MEFLQGNKFEIFLNFPFSCTNNLKTIYVWKIPVMIRYDYSCYRWISDILQLVLLIFFISLTPAIAASLPLLIHTKFSPLSGLWIHCPICL